MAEDTGEFGRISENNREKFQRIAVFKEFFKKLKEFANIYCIFLWYLLQYQPEYFP